MTVYGWPPDDTVRQARYPVISGAPQPGGGAVGLNWSLKQTGKYRAALTKKGGPPGPPSFVLSMAQAVTAAVRRRARVPTMPKPATMSTHAAGSGTAPLDRITPEAPPNPPE